eukprot:CAMPEP_0202415982 /NCGR_PEP_ID=MMETSP1128-20130828/38117_1 /ASSEMBLY_ACC=CAM_ASM_000463 /TAXON_ID=3047 /ORGANISM="Dunaliella tertiolecta, Strain CCMP1320" /LENGTH=180 /DNA_ID=CAMNT_0049022849 /DNA_START=325 /DNA_END=864 /DNA_ORIENTATION=-
MTLCAANTQERCGGRAPHLIRPSILPHCSPTQSRAAQPAQQRLVRSNWSSSQLLLSAEGRTFCLCSPFSLVSHVQSPSHTLLSTERCTCRHRHLDTWGAASPVSSHRKGRVQAEGVGVVGVMQREGHAVCMAGEVWLGGVLPGSADADDHPSVRQVSCWAAGCVAAGASSVADKSDAEAG